MPCAAAREQLSQTDSKFQMEVSAQIGPQYQAMGTNAMPSLRDPGDDSPLSVILHVSNIAPCIASAIMTLEETTWLNTWACRSLIS